MLALTRVSIRARLISRAMPDLAEGLAQDVAVSIRARLISRAMPTHHCATETAPCFNPRPAD